MNPPPSIQRNHHPIPLQDPAADTLHFGGVHFGGLYFGGLYFGGLYFGGSFDPPHLGHASLPPQAAHQLEHQLKLPAGSCRLIYVPAARSPHKESAPTADHHRLSMLNIALKDLDCPWTIWDQELKDAPLNPGQPSYWADTWAIANTLQPKATNHFLIGADQALSMHRWHRYTEFWKSAVVMMRGDTHHINTHSIDSLIQSLDQLGVWSKEDLNHWRSSCLSLEMVPWSSTSIRTQLATIDRQKNTRIEGLDPGVQSYIFDNDLYL
ncbi:MAG: nicotinate-nicotinamide nucleotide adenylyltransferase [Phycisphaerales bacterium]|nr:nicotinate-nicotinamide nucleotide adenylyltransferase [Phycisphaerales bacterium]